MRNFTETLDPGLPGSPEGVRGKTTPSQLDMSISSLARRLGLLETLALSLSLIAPTMAMSFNVSLAAKAAGPAAPLAFAIGTVLLAIVALSFVSFSKRVTHAGSVYAFIGQTFGKQAGFVAGWTLLLTYVTYAAACSILIGNFFQAAAQNYSTHNSEIWLIATPTGLSLAAVCAYRDMRLAGRLMLLLEGISVLIIVVLAAAVLVRVAHTGGLSAAPFLPAADFGGWSGVGYALVFCVLSFAGFEGAATLGEETLNPFRNIPVAMLGTCILAGAFYVFVAYAQVLGFGVRGAKSLANAGASLNDLALRYVSRDFATTVDIAAAISAFSCVLGSISAVARLLFALGRAGLSRRFGDIHPAYGTPASAVILSTIVCAFMLIFWMPFTTAANYSAYLLTIGTLALILVYIGVTAAEVADALQTRRIGWALCALAGVGVLLWPLYNSIYPAPPYPNNEWPYVVVAWVVTGAALPLLVPSILMDIAGTREGERLL